MTNQTQSPRYREEQRMTQWWLWLLIFFITATLWWSFVQQIVFGEPFGNKPGPDWMVWLFTLLFGIGLPYLLYSIRLIVTVTPDDVQITFTPVYRRTIPLTDIVACRARRYKPLQEYGGWGIKGWSKAKIAYNISGDQGVELDLTSGQQVMLGSQDIDGLAAAIAAASGLAVDTIQ